MTTQGKAGHPDERVTLTVNLRPGDVALLDMGIADLLDVARDAGTIFAHLNEEIARGAMSSEDQVLRAIMNMSARAIRSMEAEFDAIDWLDAEVRTALRQAKGGAA